ncbi:restriction endonuclease subunit S [Corynebacterium rouxii]|uniref:restriction endonuclease subunit S n=1 Tax=Corynebacterium rouxii TaxID=2719119 RepID=UPI00313E476E
MKIRDIGIVFDGPHATPKRVDSGKYFLNISSLENGRLKLENSDHVVDEDFVRWTKRVQPRKDDLLFSYETRLGEAALMPEGIEACLGRRMGLIRPNSNKINSRFLLYYWLSPAFQNQISARTLHGSTVPRISIKELPDWEIEVPEISQQSAIADVLGALDDKIAANQRVLATESQLFAALWQRASYEGVEKKHLFDLVKTQYGFTASAGVHPGSPKLLRVKDINKQEWIEWQSVPEVDISEKDFEKYCLNRNDIVVARMADPGKSAIIDSDISAVFASYLVRLIPHDRDDALYIYGFLNSNIYKNYALAVSTGSVQKNMNAKVITDVDIPWPSRDVRLDFSEKGEKIRSAMGSLVKENQVLAATRDELLPLLMNGKITVAEAKEVAGDVGVVKQNQQEEGDSSV